MASPQEYIQQIKDLGLSDLEFRASSISDAKDLLIHLRNLQKELRQIKRNINLDMKTIRAEYRERSSTAASTSSSIMTLFGQRKLAGQMRADEKRRLARERDNTLTPYEKIKLTIDSIIVKLDSAKIEVQASIDQEKSKEQPKILDNKVISNHCPQCGKTVNKQDNFCRECGATLKNN